MILKDIQQKMIQATAILLLLVFVPGCIKYHKTLPTEFPQGEITQNYSDITASYVKSTRVYDQFVTRAIFDALWLSDDVRIAYSKFHCAKRGTSVEDTEAFIARQREENNHWTTFYVLADVRDRQNTSLSDKNAPWTFYLKVGDNKSAQLSIKEVDLEPEYQRFFGTQFNLFKTAYIVKFPALDIASDQKDKAVHLIIESVDKSVTLTWPIGVAKKAETAKKKVKSDEDFYWG